MKTITLKYLEEKMNNDEIDDANRQVLEGLAGYKAKEIYGDVLPEYITNRLNDELDAFQNKDQLQTIVNVWDSIYNRQSKNNITISKSSLSNSLLFYLLELTNVNPLPKHTYCPKCHTFYWGNKKGHECECCGSLLVEDGYGLSYELLIDEMVDNSHLYAFYASSINESNCKHLRLSVLDELKLAKHLNLKNKDIDSIPQKCDEIIKCLNERYYSSKYKKYIIKHHPPFVGLTNLGSPLFQKLANVFKAASFKDLVDIYCILHGTGVYEGSNTYKIKCFSKDDIYDYLVGSQLSKDDALLTCRENRLSGKNHLSNLAFSKLKEAGVDSDMISYLKGLTHVVNKAQAISILKLELALADIYLNNPKRYYKAFFKLNKKAAYPLIENGDYYKSLMINKHKENETICYGIVDCVEREIDPKSLIK